MAEEQKLTTNPHAAAVMAANVRRGSIMSTQAYIDALQVDITKEYQPLVEAAQKLCDQWGKGNVHDRVVALREALRTVVGEEGT